MLNNQKRREILEKVKTTGYEGSVLDLYQAASQGADVSQMLEQEAAAKSQMQQQQQQQQQEQGQTQLQNQSQSTNPQESIAPPPKLNVNMNPTQMGSQAHLVQSGNPTEIGMAPTGTGAKSAAEISSVPYRKGGYKQKFLEGGYSDEELESLYDEYQMFSSEMADLTDGEDRSLNYNDYKKQVERYGSEIANNAYYGKSGNVSMPTSYIKSNQNIGFNPFTGSYDKIENLQKRFGNQVPEGYDFNTYDPDMKWMDNAPGMIGEINIEETDAPKAPTAFDAINSEITYTDEEQKALTNLNLQRGQQGGDIVRTATAEAAPYVLAGLGATFAAPLAIGGIAAGTGGGLIGAGSRQLIKPITRYGGKGFNMLSNVFKPGVSNLYRGRQLVTGSYNLMKASAVPSMYKTVGDQAITEFKGEGDLKNRLNTVTKLADLNPALSTIKEGSKITSDLAKGDYVSAGLRTTTLLPGFQKTQFGTGIKHYGTKFVNKFLDTKPDDPDAGIVKDAPQLFSDAVTGTKNLISTTKNFIMPDNRIAQSFNRRGGLRRKTKC